VIPTAKALDAFRAGRAIIVQLKEQSPDNAMLANDLAVLDAEQPKQAAEEADNRQRLAAMPFLRRSLQEQMRLSTIRTRWMDRGPINNSAAPVGPSYTY
jgi:hypothetical protein